MIIECSTYVLKNILGIYLVLFVLNKLIGYKVKIKKIPLCIFSVGLLALSTVPFFTIDDLSLARDTADFSTLLIFIIIPYCVLEVKKKLSFFWFGFIVNSVFDLAVTIIFTLTKLKSPTIINTIYIALLLICLGVLLFFWYKRDLVVPADFFEKIPTIFYVVIFIASLSTYYTMMIPQNGNYYDGVSTLLLVISAVFILFCVSYIVFKYLFVAMQQRDSLAQLDMQAKHYEELAQKNQDIRRFRHDYKNNMFALSILLEDGKYEEAKKYISDLSFTIKETENKFSTGNYLADAILANKADDAQKSNIKIAFEGTIPADQINNSDLCTILANSLDNAIRACTELSPCTIKVESTDNGKGCTITISNPVKKKIEIKNNTIKTSKKDTENHGFGIGNIKRIAEKYKGFVRLSCSDTEFSIVIGLIY